MGLGGAFMIVYFNPIVMAFFDVKERSTINGLNAVAFNVGTAIILSSMVMINDVTGGWKESLLWFSGITFVLTIAWLFIVFPKSEPQNTPKEESAEDVESAIPDAAEPAPVYRYLDGFKDSFVWSYSLCYSGLLAFYICLFTFYPKAGISHSSYVIWFGIIGTLAGMVYSKKILQRVPVIRWSGFMVTAMVVVLSFVSIEWVQLLAAMVLGFFVFFPITALVSIPHELPSMTTEKITVVFSLFWSISYMIATVVLWLFGKLVDINQGDFTASFVLISVISASFFLGSYFLPETNKKN